MSDTIKVKVIRTSRGDKLQIDRGGKADEKPSVRVARMNANGK